MIGLSDHIDLWVSKINKSLWSFAHVRQDQVRELRNTDHAARGCWKSVYSVVKITRLWLSNMTDTCFKNLRNAQRLMGFFTWLCFSDADWLSRQTPITWCCLQILSKDRCFRERMWMGWEGLKTFTEHIFSVPFWRRIETLRIQVNVGFFASFKQCFQISLKVVIAGWKLLVLRCICFLRHSKSKSITHQSLF